MILKILWSIWYCDFRWVSWRSSEIFNIIVHDLLLWFEYYLILILHLPEEDIDVVFSWRKYWYSQIIGIKIYLDWYWKICVLRLSMENIFSTWSWETNIIIGSVRLIECSRRANILLLDVMKFIDHALFSIKFQEKFTKFYKYPLKWVSYWDKEKRINFA